jgi:hypothetical protein
MMRVPEGLVRLPPDLMMSSGVHQKHAEEHDMASDAARLGVVNLNGSLRSDL